MKFIHAADLHLGTTIGVPAFGTVDPATALWQAFERLVEACLSNQVAFLLLAGDTFNAASVPNGDRQRFRDGIRRLDDAGIRTFLIHGNHDPLTDEMAFLKSIEGLHVFGSEAASTVRLDAEGVALHGRSFPAGPVPENYALTYPAPVPDFFNIGLLHTSLGGDGAHEAYAPCSVEDLSTRGYDYWALGHIHKRSCFSEKPAWIGFSGNIQGRHVRETGPKGANLVTVENRETRVELLELCGFVFDTIEVDLAETSGEQDVIDRLAAAIDARNVDRPEVLRLQVSASRDTAVFLDTQQVRVLGELASQSAHLAAGRAHLKDIKVRVNQVAAPVRLPFDLDMQVKPDLYDPVVRALQKRGLDLPPPDVGDLETYVASLVSKADS